MNDKITLLIIFPEKQKTKTKNKNKNKITCAAASSYPVVPLICPARYNPGNLFVSSVVFNAVG